MPSTSASPSTQGSDDELAPFEGRYAWCDAVCEAAGGLKLGAGGLPQSWREPDDLSYALREVARTDMASLFNYSTPLGLAALREQIVKRLRLIDIQGRDEQVLTTAGASHALDLIVRTLFKAGDCVVVETPGYAPLFDLLRLHGPFAAHRMGKPHRAGQRGHRVRRGRFRRAAGQGGRPWPLMY